MNEPEHCEISDSLVDQSLDFSLEIAALRQAGADQFDSVRLHYLEVLAHRVNPHQGRVKRILDGKLAQALAAFRARFEQAQGAAKDAIALATLHSPQAAAELQRLLVDGDFTGVRQCIATLERKDQRESLGDLVRSMAQHVPDHGESRWDGYVGSHAELKSVSYFRNTWSKLSADKQVTQALGQAPKNAGPINSHRLVLRSLTLMRDISPDYLNRFVSYVDTLLCLDQRDEAKQAHTKKAAKSENGKTIKARRARPR